MLQHDSFFFIGVFVFVFIVWIVLGGPERPLSFGTPLLAGPEELGGGTYLGLPRAPNSLGSSGVGSISVSQAPRTLLPKSSGGGSTSGSLSYTDQQAVTEAKKIAAFGTPSPSRGKVTLSHYVSSAGALSAQNEYLQLSIPSNAAGPITLTGWSVMSEVTGKSATIPKGTEVPHSGVINASEPIVLRPGDRAIISSGRSPIGASFRENVCIGYFAQYQKFSPALPISCPTPMSELELRYGPNLIRDPACADYISKRARCSLTLSPPPTLTSACQSVLTNHLTYNGCIAGHERDNNFKGTTWRIYLGRDTSLWRTTRESIKLLDASGKTVDMFSY